MDSLSGATLVKADGSSVSADAELAHKVYLATRSDPFYCRTFSKSKYRYVYKAVQNILV